MSKKHHTQQLFNSQIMLDALGDALRKLAPQQQWKNPVMFVVYIGSLLTTGLWLWGFRYNLKLSLSFFVFIPSRR